MAQPQHRGIRGETSIETVLVFPVLLLLVMTGVHMAALFHAGHVAGLASARGAHVASVGLSAHGNSLRVVDEVSHVSRELGAALASAPTVARSGDHVIVSVRVLSPRIVPFLPAIAERSARQTMETFIEEQRR
jgi:hypothetical protein